MSRIIPLTGTEASRTTKAAQVSTMELHTTNDQRRLFLENVVVAPYWHGSVASETAMLRLADRHSGTGVSAAASDNSFNDAGGFPGNWAAGDVLTVDGFTDPANLGTAFTIVSRTTTKLVVSGGTLVDEAAGATVTLTRNGAPGCWPGDKCQRSDVGTIWECVSNNGGVIGDWVEVTTDRIGTIRMWSGSTGALPTGYALCDGTGGTPDLRDKFIQCLGASTSIGDTGGAVNHKHNLSGGAATGATTSVSGGTPAGSVSVGASTTDAHTTTAVQSGAGTTVLTGPASHTVGAPSGSFSGSTLAGHSHALTGVTDDKDGRPPFYVLAFIKRVS